MKTTQVDRIAKIVIFALVPCGIALISSSAMAQEDQIIWNCVPSTMSASTREAVGDRDGHMIATGQSVCTGTSGVLKDAVWVFSVLFSYDKTEGTLIDSPGIAKKPGTIVVTKAVDGNQTLVMTDGKLTGYSGSSHIAFPIATGDAAALSGKTVEATWKNNAQINQYTLQMKLK
jgi:hypothetical protein